MGKKRRIHRLLVQKVERAPGKEIQAVAVGVAFGNEALVLGRGEAHDRFKKVTLTLLYVLAERMEVGGKVRACGWLAGQRAITKQVAKSRIFDYKDRDWRIFLPIMKCRNKHLIF